MKFSVNPTFLGVLTIVLSLIGIAAGIEGGNIVAYERLLGGILGLTSGVLILLKNNTGLLLGKVWAAIQIPYYVVMSNTNVNFAIAFHNITLYLSTTKQKLVAVSSTQLGQESTVYGINAVGIILLILFILAKKLPAKK